MSTDMLTKVTDCDEIRAMEKKAAIEYFGSLSELSRALGIQKSAVSRWRKWVPLRRAMQLEAISKGALKINLNAYLDRK